MTIFRFQEVVPDLLYRGSAPEDSIDIADLHNQYKIKQIISLDYNSANKIAKFMPKTMTQFIYPIHEDETNGRDNVLDKLDKLTVSALVNNIPTFVHCKYGIDRTGAVIARYRVENGWTPYNAVIEALKTFGFGTHVNDDYVDLYLEFINNGMKKITLDDYKDIVDELGLND